MNTTTRGARVLILHALTALFVLSYRAEKACLRFRLAIWNRILILSPDAKTADDLTRNPNKR